MCLVILFFFASTPGGRALTIIPVWDVSITSDPNAATIENTITQAIQFYEARFADPITISIEFQKMTSGLGQSTFDYYTISYTSFLSQLQTDSTTADDAYALAHLPVSSTNPVTGSASINVNTANLKALGFLGLNSSFTNGVEGIVYLNTTIMNLNRVTINPTKYDLLSVAEHEMNEVLGLGSDLPYTDNPFPQELFRYSSTGAHTFMATGDDAYFSLDGTNLLARFNQNSGGDYGDWWTAGSQIPRVQDAFGTAGATPNPMVELVTLDVQGYNLVPLPQPGILSIELSGTDLVVNATTGIATGTYHLLSSTNITLALNQWDALNTYVLTNNGSFTFTATNAVVPHSPQQFYMLQLQ